MGIIAIVGRPNVGKSSLFNRMLGRREAIVDDFPGVTRDRLYGLITRGERSFYVVDTGGIMGDIEEFGPGMAKKMEAQASAAVEESDAVIFVVDSRDGITAMDREIGEMLQRGGKGVVVAVNKCDDPNDMDTVYDAWSLGFDQVLQVSAAHGRNVDELIDAASAFVKDEEDPEDDETIPVAIVGRPNVGKSSLLNALVGEERSLVSDVPGTTRDVVDAVVEEGGTRFRFIDTAGLRRKSRVRENVEYYSNVRAYQAIDRCRVAIAVLDATEPAADQDKRLIGAVLERGKGLIVVVNKWDKVPKKEEAGDEMRDLLSDELPFASHAPKIFISAMTGRGLKKIADHVRAVDENRRRRIPTSELNRLVREVLVFERMPGDGRGRSLKVRFCTQAAGSPPAFVFFVNDPDLTSRPFERRLENIIRGMADFDGTPIKLFFRESDRSERDQRRI